MKAMSNWGGKVNSALTRLSQNKAEKIVLVTPFSATQEFFAYSCLSGPPRRVPSTGWVGNTFSNVFFFRIHDFRQAQFFFGQILR